MFGRDLNEKHFCNTCVKISEMRKQKMPIFTFPLVSQWKLKVAIATKVHEQPQ